MTSTDVQMKTWNSDLYKHFKLPLEIIEEKGEVKYRFRYLTMCVHYP